MYLTHSVVTSSPSISRTVNQRGEGTESKLKGLVQKARIKWLPDFGRQVLVYDDQLIRLFDVRGRLLNVRLRMSTAFFSLPLFRSVGHSTAILWLDRRPNLYVVG